MPQIHVTAEKQRQIHVHSSLNALDLKESVQSSVHDVQVNYLYINLYGVNKDYHAYREIYLLLC